MNQIEVNNFTPNLYINSVSNRFTKQLLLECFQELNFGKINNIILKKDKFTKNSSFNDVYIYFDNWNIEYTEYIRYLLKKDKHIIIQYENTTNWIVKAMNNNN